VLTELSITVQGFVSCKLLKCLSSLAFFSRLRVLSLDCDLKELPALPSQLEELTFHSALAKQISPVSTLTNLWRLNLEECYGLEDLTPIQACTALEILNVYNCYSLEAWPDLGALKSLRDLCVVRPSGLDDLSCLAALTALTSLCFTNFPSAANVEALAGLTQLRDLTISCVMDVGDDEEEGNEWQQRLTSALTCLVGLTNLHVVDAELDTLEWCSALTNLRSLSAGGNHFQSLESLPSCTSLVQLDLSHSASLIILRGLQRCISLANLDLSSCRQMSSLEPLRCCTALTRLSFLYSSNIPSLEPLKNLPKPRPGRMRDRRPARPRAPARPAQLEDHWALSSSSLSPEPPGPMPSTPSPPPAG
jgi:Leucine-rich repeat (LRR) protein